MEERPKVLGIFVVPIRSEGNDMRFSFCQYIAEHNTVSFCSCKYVIIQFC